MSRSQKWKDEWAFFLDTDGRRKYNDQCRRCIHDCKQSFRTEVVACPRYFSKRSEDAVYCQDKGRK
ncbi:hypothetical protein SAMN05216343_10757 [Oscillibacter sp. PC13]|nr:hypothetical protein [Oscillibacter sp. PC13]SFP41956.1 hypothetical protein SAMN05216343_10757 [Oscillibacter sp. PC13]